MRPELVRSVRSGVVNRRCPDGARVRADPTGTWTDAKRSDGEAGNVLCTLFKKTDCGTCLRFLSASPNLEHFYLSDETGASTKELLVMRLKPEHSWLFVPTVLHILCF